MHVLSQHILIGHFEPTVCCPLGFGSTPYNFLNPTPGSVFRDSSWWCLGGHTGCQGSIPGAHKLLFWMYLEGPQQLCQNDMHNMLTDLLFDWVNLRALNIRCVCVYMGIKLDPASQWKGEKK